MKFNRLKKILQGETKSNRLVLEAMKNGRYPMSRIRKTLLELNDVNLQELANGKIGVVTLYNTVRGLSPNEQAREMVAESLGLKVKEVFPD
ncbi:MAG: hypothetical protein ABIG11_00910 [bacterium]